MSRPGAAVLALAALASCSDGGYSDDPFPIQIDRAGGALVVQVAVGDAAPAPMVLDLLSPLTLLDASPIDVPRRRSVTLTVFGHRSPDNAALIPRARFGATAIYLHPCEDDGDCAVGAPGAPLAIAGVIGADTLRGDALRFRPAEDRIAILPDVAGDGPARDRTCDAELPSPFYGGGTLILGGTEIEFSGLRIALGLCLSPDPDQVDPARRGTDAAMVLSTGIGPSILGTARYQAWAAAAGGPPLASLPPATVLLPSGPISGRLARIPRLAIVGTATAPRGACREVYSHHLLAVRDCALGDDCPCSSDVFCSAPSVTEVDAELEALVVPDTHPLLQALRAELRPAQPEIDGVLGVSALDALEVDVDYPHDRLLFRCAGPGCVVRPALRDRASRPIIDTCVAKAIPALDAGLADADDGDAIIPLGGR